MPLEIPSPSLVLLIGASGSGKSTFARRHFKATEILSSDAFRGMVADDETDQSATVAAFDALHYVAAKRLHAGRLTVVDATNVHREARASLIAIARRHYLLPVGIVFDVAERLCLERHAARTDRHFGAGVIRRQCDDLRRSIAGLAKEGLRVVHHLRTPEEIEAATIERRALYADRRGESGPFDIIGDVHGCADELEDLLTLLGYEVRERRPGVGLSAGPVWAHPAGRKAIFLGDLVDRGPRVLDVLRIARNMTEAGSGLCVPGNHDAKLQRALQDREVRIAHGLERSLAEIEAVPEPERAALKREIVEFLEGLVSHYVLDGGRLVVAHAGMKAAMQGRAAREVRDFALYGETTGEVDEFGLPVRISWATEYRGTAHVVYGHTPVRVAEWLNRTINIDTGCVFGGRLTALRWPEQELVGVPALRAHWQSARPFPPEASTLTAQQNADSLLDLEDVAGRRSVETRLGGFVTVREENACAALEGMSRFAIDPRWLITLPPTMSPPETSAQEGLLEHPAEAFDYFAREGVDEVVCEEKHMGSRAIAVVCRDEDAARRRFGVPDDGAGIVFTRTGRRFFEDRGLERAFLDALHAALDRSGLWDGLATEWLCLDGELLPWSAKARELLRAQYAAAGAAARAAFAATLPVLDRAAARLPEAATLAERYRDRAERAGRFVDTYRRYCWPVAGLADLRFAPFHLLASEGAVHVDRDHRWHLERLDALCNAEPGLFQRTPRAFVALRDDSAVEAATRWWQERTEAGSEGMVVKPAAFLARGRKGWVQPGVKCRGREYLRLIYGPEYDRPEHLARLRERNVGAKRALALKEFALGIEALERFVRREPLRRVHECVFALLALESEPVDPRL